MTLWDKVVTMLFRPRHPPPGDVLQAAQLAQSRERIALELEEADDADQIARAANREALAHTSAAAETMKVEAHNLLKSAGSLRMLRSEAHG